MDIKKMTNEELKAESKRLDNIFEECKEKMDVLLDTMDKASESFIKIKEELKSRGIDLPEQL